MDAYAKVSISARVIIQDGGVNVNEILHEAGKFGDLLKEVMAERIIEHYQEAVVSRMHAHRCAMAGRD